MHTDERSREEHARRDSGLSVAKEADVKREGDNLQGSSPEDVLATTALKSAKGQAQQQPWRTEPEIDVARQEQLIRCLATTPDTKRGIYPFKGMRLSRADVEWLLATYGNAGDPSAGSNEQRIRWRLDLRGADLRYVDLHALPLARLRGSLTRKEWDEATEEQRTAAEVLLTGADLSETHLEEAELIGAHLEKVSLHEAHLEKADLAWAHLERAFLARARLKEADLSEAHLEKADLSEVHLQGATLRWTHLEQAYLNGARLEKADLSRARLEKAYLSEARLEQADLSEAHLEEGYLSGVYLQEADLSRAHLEGAYLGEAHLEDASLYRAHLERAFLYKAHLEGARLSRTHVEVAKRKKAESGEQLIGPSLADAQWSNVNLAVVQWSQVDMLGDEYKARQATQTGERKNNMIRLEEYEAAVRANRQLAVALRAQGLDEEAARFGYRAQLLQRIVLRRQGKIGQYLFSLLLDLLAGYGYRPGRSLMAYLFVIFSFMCLYLLNAHGAAAHLSWDEALVLSVSSFHGRGFFLQNVALGDALVRLAAAEAVLGLLIEVSFIATFTQRFFGR